MKKIEGAQRSKKQKQKQKQEGNEESSNCSCWNSSWEGIGTGIMSVEVINTSLSPWGSFFVRPIHTFFISFLHFSPLNSQHKTDIICYQSIYSVAPQSEGFSGEESIFTSAYKRFCLKVWVLFFPSPSLGEKKWCFISVDKSNLTTECQAGEQKKIKSNLSPSALWAGSKKRGMHRKRKKE